MVKLVFHLFASRFVLIQIILPVSICWQNYLHCMLTKPPSFYRTSVQSIAPIKKNCI